MKVRVLVLAATMLCYLMTLRRKLQPSFVAKLVMTSLSKNSPSVVASVPLWIHIKMRTADGYSGDNDE